MRESWSVYFIVMMLMIFVYKQSDAYEQLDLAERLMLSEPDSSLIILDEIDVENLSGKEEKARYSLLKSMALDKNYIDTTTFDVLQPAIDYYLKNGSPNEKLQTLYYQGRIFQNQGDEGAAMRSFINAREITAGVTDTLSLAHLLVAQGTLYYSSYKIDDFITNNLVAANLYKSLGKIPQEMAGLARALDGSIINNNKELADSIISVCNELIEKYPDERGFITPYILSYTVNFGTEQDIKDALDILSKETELSDEIKIDLANGYLKINDYKSAQYHLNAVGNEDFKKSLKYLSTKTDILQANGDFQGALSAYKEYSTSLENIHSNLFSQDLLFAEERHDLEMATLKEAAEKEKIIWVGICCVFILAILIGYLYYRNRLARAKRFLAEKEKSQLELERDRLALSAENLELRISQLENESANLKEILQNQKELAAPIENAIKERIEMLNGLLAKEISENDSYAKPYGDWIDKIMKDKDSFMDSTRLAFKASHPKFMEYLEDHGLSEFEINYLCLYAIGLRGKEVGEYIQLKRHYNISSEIRKKLGIDEHETNIGIYVRKLMKRL